MSQKTPQKRRRWPPIFLGLLVGFLLGALTVALYRKPGAVLSSKLLEWPFLTFVLIACFVLLFFNSLEALIARGEFTIAWGKDQSIKVRDLSSALDEELDPIRDDIEELKKEVGQSVFRPKYLTLRKPTDFVGIINPDEAGPAVFEIDPPAVAAAAPFPDAAPKRQVDERVVSPTQVTSLNLETTDARIQRLRSALADPEFKWRSTERLADVIGATQEEVVQLILSQPDMRLSRGKSGRQIAGLTSRVGP